MRPRVSGSRNLYATCERGARGRVSAAAGSSAIGVARRRAIEVSSKELIAFYKSIRASNPRLNSSTDTFQASEILRIDNMAKNLITPNKIADLSPDLGTPFWTLKLNHF